MLINTVLLVVGIFLYTLVASQVARIAERFELAEEPDEVAVIWPFSVPVFLCIVVPLVFIAKTIQKVYNHYKNI